MKSKVIRNLLIFVGIFVVVIVAYKVFFAGPAAPDGALQSTSPAFDAAAAGLPPEDALVGQEFLSMLLNIKNLELDYAIFSDPSFGTLVDFSRPLVQDSNPGRTNPFAPFGVDAVAPTFSPITTAAPSSVTKNSVTLNATITLSGTTATRWFEYGMTEALGTKTIAVNQTSSNTFGQTVSGLTPLTTYYAKAVAQIGTTIYAGEIVTWQTLAEWW